MCFEQNKYTLQKYHNKINKKAKPKDLEKKELLSHLFFRRETGAESLGDLKNANMQKQS